MASRFSAFFFFLLLVGLFSCSQKSTPATSATRKPAASARSTSEDLGRNNVVTTQRDGVIDLNGSGSLKITGSNNLIDIISENSAYFSNRDVVVVVQGDNNIITLYNRNVIDLSAPGMDKLVFMGDNEKFALSTQNNIILKKQKLHVDTVTVNPEPVSASSYQPDLEYTAEELKALEAGLNAGDPETYFELAKTYQFEIDKPEAILKAIELYEFAAAKNHILAIRNLGDIYANGSFDLKPNLQKALYFFTLGANQQDEYSQQRLEELRKK